MIFADFIRFLTKHTKIRWMLYTAPNKNCILQVAVSHASQPRFDQIPMIDEFVPFLSLRISGFAPTTRARRKVFLQPPNLNCRQLHAFP